MTDNRATRKHAKGPDFKCTNKGCMDGEYPDRRLSHRHRKGSGGVSTATASQKAAIPVVPGEPTAGQGGGGGSVGRSGKYGEVAPADLVTQQTVDAIWRRADQFGVGYEAMRDLVFIVTWGRTHCVYELPTDEVEPLRVEFHKRYGKQEAKA